MSERKTTEIKLRVAESDKTSWQLAAEEEGLGLSEFARRAMNDRAKKAECWGYEIPVVVSELVPPGYAIIKNITDAQGLEGTPKAQENLAESVALATLKAVISTPGDEDPSVAPVSTSGEVDRVAKPWMFEARKGD